MTIKTGKDGRPGYGRSETGMTVHRTQPDGRTYCGAEVATIGDRESSLDAVRNHGATSCFDCGLLVSARQG